MRLKLASTEFVQCPSLPRWHHHRGNVALLHGSETHTLHKERSASGFLQRVILHSAGGGHDKNDRWLRVTIDGDKAPGVMPLAALYGNNQDTYVIEFTTPLRFNTSFQVEVFITISSTHWNLAESVVEYVLDPSDSPRE